MINITHKEYQEEIRNIAEYVHSEALEAHPEDEDDRNEFRYERVNETVDGHMWIIYYAYNLSVLQHSGNEDTYQDVYGNDDLGYIIQEQGLKGLHSAIAYFAMVADINEAIDDL